jgi:hypothetical protein
MLMRNYGLYWRAEDVYWGTPGRENEGTLEGHPTKSKRTGPTNFREQAGVYVLYDHLRPVYVGETGVGGDRLFKRLRWHYRVDLKARWDTFSWFGVYPVNPKSRKLRVNVRVNPKIGDILYHVEAVLIAAMEPPLNFQRGKFGKAERYDQARSENLLPPHSEMIEKIYEKYFVDVEET